MVHVESFFTDLQRLTFDIVMKEVVPLVNQSFFENWNNGAVCAFQWL